MVEKGFIQYKKIKGGYNYKKYFLIVVFATTLQL